MTHSVFIVMTAILRVLSVPSGRFVVDAQAPSAESFTRTYELGLAPFTLVTVLRSRATVRSHFPSLPKMESAAEYGVAISDR